MIRFEHGQPKYIWFSQHVTGEAYDFGAVRKNPPGKRPLVYCANGSHALYPLPGPHDYAVPNLALPLRFRLVDETDTTGPIYDPLLTSYYYIYTPFLSTFMPFPVSNSRRPFFHTLAPTGFLYFKGRWGDQRTSDVKHNARGKDQKVKKVWASGPTGPLDKQLGRSQIWPKDVEYEPMLRHSLNYSWVLEKWLGGVNCLWDNVKVKGVKVNGELAE